MKTIFIVKIQLESDSYEFRKGDIIEIPVLTNSSRNAEQKVMTNYMGSEYPTFKFIGTIKEHRIFKPIL